MLQNHFFSIDTPPPTVSGHLHMGHIFSYCHADFIARFHKMCGKNVIYPIGFDDNGLPTERLVEKITGAKVGFHYSDKSKDTLRQLMNQEFSGICTKEEFIRICKFIITDAEYEFEKLFKAINLSVNWDFKYQSISDTATKIAQSQFVNLMKKGLIYQKNAPVYWCTQDKTATANTEIEEKEMPGMEVKFHFQIQNSDLKLEVMSTRCEMIPACVALFYNPQDTRFKHLKNTNAITPITKHVIPILPDEDVQIDKGTGLVMCCTYGDWQDVIWTQRHNLKENIIISKYGELIHEIYKTENGKYLKVPDARSQIIQLLEDENCVIEKKQILHNVKCAERSGKALEIIPAMQWYVKTLIFKNILFDLCKFLNFHPENMRIKLENWINGLSQDWCISRNRFFGINIPDSSDLILDTWFTSGLTTQIVREVVHKAANIDIGRQLSLRPQAHEIIRTWTFCTMVQSYLSSIDILDNYIPNGSEIDLSYIDILPSLEGVDSITAKSGDVYIKIPKPQKSHLPWTDVMLSGWCLAEDKSKMSKSKGNVVTPIPLIEKYGSDAVRYWSASSALGTDTAYNEGKLNNGNRLVTKLKNASHFAFTVIKNANISILSAEYGKELNICETVDKWILTKLANVFAEYKKHFYDFEYSKALHCAEKFFWSDFCDNYLELIKVRSYGLEANIYHDVPLSNDESESIIKSQVSAAETLNSCIHQILQMFAPFIPSCVNDICEVNSFNFMNFHYHKEFVIGESICQILAAVRKAKSDQNLSLKTQVKAIYIPANLIGDQSEAHLPQDFIHAACATNATIKISHNEDIKIELITN